uniref:Homeobox domain-containing protein n=1 Tax=Anser cygnoides TaxID=8845 RepID=A0A8B9EP24_ANSCY
MTKAPFSVEWLSQSSQAPKSPTQGTPRRAPSSAAVRQPSSGSGPGLSEGSKEKSSGKGGRSRERLAAPPAAGNRCRRGFRAGWGGTEAGRPPPPRALGLADPFLPLPRPQEQASGRGQRGGPSRRGDPRAPRRRRIGTLESSFQRHRYLGAAERRKLAGRMRLSEVQVSIKTWFQNRRMKLKRQLQELRPEAFCGAPLPYGPQSGVVSLPLTCAAPPPALPRQEAAPGGFALAALPAPTLDLSSACRAHVNLSHPLKQVSSLSAAYHVALPVMGS